MPNPSDSSLFTAIHHAAKKAGHVAKTVGGAEMTAFISANATFNLLSSIFAGYPNITREVLKELAKYQIPAVGVPIAIIAALNSLNVKHTKVPHRLVKSFMSAIGMTSFFVPLMMEVITRIIQIIEKESRSSPVWISNEAAAVIIGGCSVTGLLQAMQTYYLDIKAKHPTKASGCLSKATTNKGLRITLGAINVASAVHGAIMATEKIIGINTESNAAYYSRSGITLIMGLIGAIVLGSDESHSKPGTKRFLGVINIIQLYNLALAFTGTFFLSPAAEPVFGEAVINEQIWLWTTVIPLLVSLIMAVNSCMQDEQDNNIDEQNYLINDSSDYFASDDEDELELNTHIETVDKQNIAPDPYKPIALAIASNSLSINSDTSDSEEGFFPFLNSG